MEDKNIELKKQLIEKAKEIADNPQAQNLRRHVNDLKKAWKGSREDISYLEQELQDQFDSYMNVIVSRLGEEKIDVESKKKELIEKAKQVLESSSIRKASNQMKDLFEDWKTTGHTDKETDDALWAEFNEIRNQFYAKRKEYYENLSVQFAENEQKKNELIEKSIAANENITDIKELTNTMNGYMDEWKTVGSASKQKDDELWAKFLEQRKLYFKKRDSYYENMKALFKERAEKKREIIAQAKILLARSEFTQEETQAINDLRDEWKTVGNAGRDNDNELWEQFRTIINKYFENRRFYREDK